MPPSDASYLKNLRSINSIATLFYVAGYTSVEQDAVLASVRSPYLDTIYSNIRPRVSADFPPDFVRDLAKVDRIKRRLASVYAASGDEKLRKKCKNLYACGSAQMLLFDDIVDKALLLPYACNSRFCPTCNRRRSATLHERCTDKLRQIPGLDSGKANILWLTLTVKNPPYGHLDSAIKDLLWSFRELRRGASHRQKSQWAKNVKGYFWNFEITQNTRKRSWHPHIHVLMDSAFMRQAALNATFCEILARRDRVGKVMLGAAYTTDSEGKRYKPGPRGWDAALIGAAVHEVAKYNLKPMDSERIGSEQIIELTRALHNKRLFGSGGDWLLDGIRRDAAIYSAPVGLARFLRMEDDQIATLMDQGDSVGRAHSRSCSDAVVAAGLARTYSSSATAQHFARLIDDD